MLPEIPSGSGITAFRQSYLVNGDNGSFLYNLAQDGRITDSMLLLNHDPSQHTVAKPSKHDFEAATMVRVHETDLLLLLGSGTMSPTRDSALLFDPQRPQNQQAASLRPFYDSLIRRGIPARSLNIEATAVAGTDILLFNRGNNSMVRMPLKAFLDAAFSGMPFPAPVIGAIDLPEVDGRRPGVSGATTIDGKTVLFCASLEATEDWTKDGEVLGSGIGLIDVSDKNQPRLLSWKLVSNPDGSALREKLEGIEVISKNGKSLRVRCVADNDNNTSTLIDLELRIH